MKFLFIILISIAANIAAASPQLRNLAIMKNNQDLLQVQNEISFKKDQKRNFEVSVKDLNSTLSLSRSFGMTNKVKKLKIDLTKVQNDLQQINLDLLQLEKNKKGLIESQKKLIN